MSHTRMKVLEFGIILNGISVLYRQYASDESLNPLKGDPDLRNSLLGAIISMTRSVLVQNINFFDFKQYKLLITRPIISSDISDSPELLFYSITEKKIDIEYLTEKMEQIQNRFLTLHPDILQTTGIETAKFTPFLPIVDEILEDLKDTHSQRFGHIF